MRPEIVCDGLYEVRAAGVLGPTRSRSHSSRTPTRFQAPKYLLNFTIWPESIMQNGLGDLNECIPSNLLDRLTSPADWALVRSDEPEPPPYWCFQPHLSRPASDCAEYRLIRLTNGMEVLLCSDLKTTTSGASLIVPVGTFDQPRNIPGLAHLAEHCVMSSVNKGAGDDGDEGHRQTFYEFLYANGQGTCSATTETEHTTFDFTVAPHRLEETLHRFSAIFSTLSLSPIDVGREVLAVHSEFQRMRDFDTHHLTHLNYLLSRDQARCRRFFEGDYASLTGVQQLSEETHACPLTAQDPKYLDIWEGVGKAVMAWWAEHYFKRPPTLAIVGRESLDCLAAAASAAFSSSIAGAEFVAKPVSEDESRFMSPWSASHERTVVYVRGAEFRPRLDLRWVIPCTHSDHQTRYSRILCAVLEQRGPGSVFHSLCAKGWLCDFAVYVEGHTGREGHEYLRVSAVLSDAGWVNWRCVMQTVQAYLALLQTSDLDVRVIDDIISLAQARYDFTQRDDVIPWLRRLAATLLLPVARQDLLCSDSLYADASVDGFHLWLNARFDLRRMRAMLQGSQWDSVDVGADDSWQASPWYGDYEYMVAPLSDDLSQAALVRFAEEQGLRCPHPNPFTPRSLMVLEPDDAESNGPILLCRTPGSIIWHKRNSRFRLPLGSVYCRVWSPHFSGGPRVFARYCVLFDMIFGQLSEVLFQAEKTSYPISWDYTGHDGLTLRFDGFTDKLFGIFCYVLDAIAQFNVAAHDFTYYCNRFFNSLWERDPSGIDSYGEQCNPRAVLNGLLSENTYSPRCLLDAVKELSQGEVQDALILLKAQVQVTMLVYGNINSQDALKYEGAWQQQFSPLEEPTVRPQWLSLQQGSQIVYEAPSHDPNTSKLCWIAELCNADEPRLHAMGLLAANHLAQCVQQHLAARYDIGYYGAIAPVVCAGKLWISITCNTFHDVSFVQRCIDGFVAESIESLRKLDGREFTRRWGMFAEQHHERSQRGFRSERNFLLEQLQSGVDSPFTLYTDVYNSLSTVSQQEVVQFMQTVLHPLSPRCTTISARLTTPRALSQSATQATLTFLKASGARIADNLSSSLLHGTTSLTDAISVFQQACAGAVTPEHVASIVRVAAETYPAGGSDTVRLPLEYPAEGAEEIIIDRFLQSTHFLDNIPDLRRRLRETPRGNGSRVALRSSLTMDQYETTWTKREESSGAMPVIPLLAAAVN